MTRWIDRVAAAWTGYWFRPEPPEALAVCRVLLYGGLLAVFLDHDFTICSRLGQDYWAPTSFARLLFRHGPPTVAEVACAQAVWKISLLTACLGLATRVSTVVACVLGVILLQLPNDLGKQAHSMAPASVALIVMALSACGRVGSLDWAIARWRGRVVRVSEVETGWPIHTMRVVLCLVFFCAGLHKARTSGLHWVFSDNMQMLMIAQRRGGITPWIVQHPALCVAMAAFGLTTEFFYPLALLSKRLALIWVPAGVMMFTGIYVTLGIDFRFLAYLSFFWLPWGRIFRPAASGRNKD
jgi:hypothetical protein